MIDEKLSEVLQKIQTGMERTNAEIDAICRQAAPTIECSVHGNERPLSREMTWRAIRGGQRQPAYEPCPLCRAARDEQSTVDRLNRAGVPLNLCRATLENWKPQCEAEEHHLDHVRAFIRVRRGFLIMLGELGTGKSHLAAAITRHFRMPLYIKQSELLRRLRATYRDKAAVDPVDQAQDCDLLVLDEVGLSPGGRDELPMLHDVLDHRYNERKPTVLTGNVSLESMEGIIGERMADRLRESAFAVLTFGGMSQRRAARGIYFDE